MMKRSILQRIHSSYYCLISHRLRGSIKVVVKLQFLENDNPLRDSSAGVQFFSASTLSAQCFFIHEIIGSIFQHEFALLMHVWMCSCIHVFHSDMYANCNIL